MASRPKDRRDTILRTAAGLFAERGYSSVSVDDIGGAVGVSGPAIYHHFRGKRGLLRELMLETAVGHAEVVEGAAAEEGATLESILAAAARLVLAEREQTAAYLRERDAGHELDADVLAAETRLTEGWKRATARFVPDVGGRAALLRRTAAFAVMTAGARDAHGLRGQALEEALVRATAAVLRCPARTDGGGPPTRWAPTVTRREEILASALALFRDRGVGAVTMTDIGAAVGLTGPTVYHYFASKAEIVGAAFGQAAEHLAAATSVALRQAIDPEDALERLVRGYVGVAVRDVDLVVVTAREHDVLHGSHRALMRRRHAEDAGRWDEVLRRCRPELAVDLSGLLVSGAFTAVVAGAPFVTMGGPDDDLIAVVLALLKS